jgi:isoleucyl-tRNA synthetase
MFDIDKWAMQQLQKLIADVTEGYENFAFHRVFSLIYNFCTVEMSSVYMDVLKDRMYCDERSSLSRRSGQTAMYRILDCLVRMLAPILVHTAEEVWGTMKFKSENVDTVHLLSMPESDNSILADVDSAKWDELMYWRTLVLGELEELRKNQLIGSNQEASVTINTENEKTIAVLEEFGLEQFSSLCIVSEVKLQKTRGKRIVEAEKSGHQKCQRCWNYRPSVGADSEHRDLCERCVEVIKAKN